MGSNVRIFFQIIMNWFVIFVECSSKVSSVVLTVSLDYLIVIQTLLPRNLTIILSIVQHLKRRHVFGISTGS